MATISTLLNTLQAISTEHPTAFAVMVIMVIITEALILVSLPNLLLKIFSRLTSPPSDRPGNRD